MKMTNNIEGEILFAKKLLTTPLYNYNELNFVHSNKSKEQIILDQFIPLRKSKQIKTNTCLSFIK